ncbi:MULTISPECIES: uroporphyrinogen-III synthase [unclassified Enterococcus]|uniref:uroporphyrinogen-III synthase n=1 Tax=unclassified Enterococcus TaxID=2608891 RepID=UPI001CE1FE38|nr:MULTISPECIES: uroporphyrinogen-III synthase [unclassified Enterococcus]MCA5013996.1 uroporphyrinogen-III synthase [Enterococcus sp. S23]MCA5017230.1 uroporphyrinogen-III synthase [Enterococcus sp. S22(2020)]
MKKILLTRMIEDNRDDRVYFQEQGFETVEIPLIALKQHSHPTFGDELKKCEWIFLTSQHAAKFFLEQVREEGMMQQLHSKKFAVIGTKTANILLNNHLEIFLVAPEPTKKSLFHFWLEHQTESTSIFYPKSNLADSAWEDILLNQGHTLYAPVIYINFFPDESKKKLRRYLNEEEFAAVYFASPSLWVRFFTLYSELRLEKMPVLYCLGETTKKAIKKMCYDAIVK